MVPLEQVPCDSGKCGHPSGRELPGCRRSAASVLGRPAAGVTERDARNPGRPVWVRAPAPFSPPTGRGAGGRGASGAPGSPSLSSTRRLPVLPLWPSGVTADSCEAWSRTAAWAPPRLRLPASPLSWGRSPFLWAGLPGCCSLKTPPSGGLSRPLSRRRCGCQFPRPLGVDDSPGFIEGEPLSARHQARCVCPLYSCL